MLIALTQCYNAHLELPCALLQAPHLVQSQPAAAPQHTAGGVDPAGQLKVAQRLTILLLLDQDLAQTIPALRLGGWGWGGCACVTSLAGVLQGQEYKGGSYWSDGQVRVRACEL